MQPELALRFAVQHDANVWQCFCNLLGVNPDQIPANSVQTASLPLRLGGLGLRSAERTLPAAHWASWADSLAMINARHPAVAGSIMRALETNVEVPFVREVQRCVDTLVEADFAVPSWEELADGVRPPPSHDEEEPNQSKHGWQKVAGHSLDDRKLQVVSPMLSACDQALLRSQAGPLAAVPFTCFPTSRLTRLDPPVFRTLLLRRLRVPLPLTVRACRCGLFLDAFGHHRSACAVSGVLGRRGFAVESAAARICREAGARVMVNVFVRDLDLGVVDRLDARRLEIVADGLPLFGGAQLAIDTTLVSAIRQDGTPRRGAATRDGVALTEARRRKARTYPELTGQGAGGGNRRSVVQRDCIVLVFTSTCQIQGSAGRDARKCSGSLASQVGFDAQLCCCSGVRTVTA